MLKDWHKYMWSLKTGGICGRLDYIQNVGATARCVWSLKTGGLLRQWSFKTGYTVTISV